MGESAKILNPEKTVLMPDMAADCPMAHMASAETIEKIRSEYDDLAVVCYINSTAELKRHSDASRGPPNAVKIVKALPNKNIFFIPDRNLAHYIAGLVPEKNFIYNEGFVLCTNIWRLKKSKQRKQRIRKQRFFHIRNVRQKFWNFLILLEKYFRNHRAGRKIRRERIYHLYREWSSVRTSEEKPGEEILLYRATPICRNMKKVTLEKVLHVLKTGENEVFVDDKLREESKKPLERMLELAK